MKKFFSYFVVSAIALFTACTPTNTPDDPTNPENPNDTIASGDTGQTDAENPNDTITSGDTGQTDAGKMVAVDLGLSVKWATCNVGANKPSEYGSYFAWGEVQPKTSYTEDNYKWLRKNYVHLYDFTKYNGTDGLEVLLKEDDAATVNWGDKWRMPTYEEWGELEQKCICEMAFNQGVKGWEVTGPSGKSLFFPAAGYYWETSIYEIGNVAEYWSSTRAGSYAYRYAFGSLLTLSSSSRYLGLPIRPVCPKE